MVRPHPAAAPAAARRRQVDNHLVLFLIRPRPAITVSLKIRFLCSQQLAHGF
ncbi:hypothetical protein JYU34_000312 [Plutella xylostella]|uniref:Uncharacterized protein n=1 Tax=Plutella xylostella TaxID=51655 RepID=A0ABQ7R7K2_PLUXY|nr:hypothetical protein JYU34_000312 [Plutella xylostella]